MSQVRSVLCILALGVAVTFSVGCTRTIQERVEAGASFLDEHYSDFEWDKWDKRIEISSLHMENDRQCLLGQLYGHYTFGRWTLDISRDTSAELGFAAFDRKSAESFNLLTAEWRKVIFNRRNKTYGTGKQSPGSKDTGVVPHT